MMDRLRHSEPESLTSADKPMPEEFDRIVRKCLAKEPAGRYQSAGALLMDLRILERHSDPAAALFPVDQPQHNLPADLTTFVGRQKEVTHLADLLGSARLVTLTGAGGSGKTRLAQQLAGRVVSTFAQGAWFVDLAPIADADLLAAVVARVLDVPEKTGATIEQALLDWLRPRQLLLILDNCEHLVDACAAFAESLLRHAPALRVLATSREALNAPGEAVWRVPPLAVPVQSATVGLDEMLGFDAIRLFADRAAAVSSFQITEENITTVADICRRLDGVPLAIELAAARVKLLSVTQIRDRLHDRFRLLVGGGRTAVARQRTLEATVDWSYELLENGERRVLGRLSVFSGGWTLEAAEHVCGGRGLDSREVLDLLSRLVDKSLVIVDEAGAERRYGSSRRSGSTREIGSSSPAKSRQPAALIWTICWRSHVRPNRRSSDRTRRPGSIGWTWSTTISGPRSTGACRSGPARRWTDAGNAPLVVLDQARLLHRGTAAPGARAGGAGTDRLRS